MVLPTFDDMMLPLLEFLSDDCEKNYSQVKDHLANHFKLSQDDLKLEKPSGGYYFYNRIGWAKGYMTRAGLLEKKIGKFNISSRGMDVLKRKPSKIDRKFLCQFKEFDPYVPKLNKKSELSDNEKSPDDLIDDGISQINDILNADLLEKLKTVDPIFFERLVLHLMEELGYGKGKHVGKSGDKGIDGEIPQDKLGLDVIYLQAKRHSSNVSAGDLRNFIGALSLKKARKGIFVTTADFPQGAYDDVKKSEKNIVLINGKKLVNHMIEHDVGIKTKKSLKIKEIDEKYFEE